MKVQTNLREAEVARLKGVLVESETVSGFVAVAVEREIARRERGGKVVVTARLPGRPKKSAGE